MFVATSTSTEITSPPPLPKLPPPPPVPPLPSNTVPVTANVSTNNTNSRTSTGNGKRGKDTDLLTHCNVCDMSGTSQNLVMLVYLNTSNIYFLNICWTYEFIIFRISGVMNVKNATTSPVLIHQLKNHPKEEAIRGIVRTAILV